MKGTNHDTTGHGHTNQPVSGHPEQPQAAHHSGEPISAHPHGVPYADGSHPEPQPDPYHYAHPEANEKGWKKLAKSSWGVVKLVGGALIIAMIIVKFVFQPYQVYGRSMVPTLQEGDRLIIVKTGKTWATITGSDYVPNRGEIVVFKSPLQTNENLIKRVIGLPGDRVLVSDGIITVFNEEYPGGFNPDLPYEDSLPVHRTGDIDTVVGEGQLFVSGDNRTATGSLDSRNQLGLVPTDNLVGELVLRIVPLSESKFF